MAWDDDAPLILRQLLQDTDATPVYTDDTLTSLFLVTVPILTMQVSFANTYTVNLSNGTLTPDPTATTPRDDPFITLCCLLSAKNLMVSEVRNLTRQGIDIQDGDSRIKLARDPRALQLMKDTFGDMYDDAVYAYKTGGDVGFGEIITGPYKFIEGGTWGAGSMYDGYPGGHRSLHGSGGLY